MATENQLPADVAEWTLEHAERAIQDAIRAAPGGKDAFDANAKYVEEQDHWQEGNGWVGPNAEGADGTVVTRVMAGVERQFTPVDLITECLHRGANGLFKHQADVQLAPLNPIEGANPDGTLTDEQQAQEAEQKKRADATMAIISAWWDRVHLWTRVRDAYVRSRWSGRGLMRLWIPAAHTENNALPSGLDLEEALQRLELSAPAPDAATVYVHPETHQPIAIYVTELDGEKVVELWTVDPEGGEDPDTIVRQIAKDETVELRIPMGGRLPVNQMEADVLITEAVRRQQKRLNFYESILVRVGEAAGFPERYISNASPQGILLTTPPDTPTIHAPVIHNGVTYYVHEVPRTLGAQVTTELRGFEYGEGETPHITTPQVTIKEPTDPDYAIKAAWHARRTILEACKQAHVLTNSEAAPSGYSREQARADFEDDLDGVKSAAEMLIAETLAAALAIAHAMGADDVLAEFRPVVTLHIHSGPVSPEEREQNTAKQAAGLLSRETSMARDGVEDVDAEIQRIDAGPYGQLALLTKRAEALRALTDAGLGVEGAMKLVGFTDEEIEEAVNTPPRVRPDDEEDEDTSEIPPELRDAA
jgi:hypothetical protein